MLCQVFYLQQVWQVSLSEWHKMFVEFNELEVFLVEKTTEADEGREEKSEFTFLIKAVLLKANEIKQLIMTILANTDLSKGLCPRDFRTNTSPCLFFEPADESSHPRSCQSKTRGNNSMTFISYYQRCWLPFVLCCKYNLIKGRKQASVW